MKCPTCGRAEPRLRGPQPGTHRWEWIRGGWRRPDGRLKRHARRCVCCGDVTDGLGYYRGREWRPYAERCPGRASDTPETPVDPRSPSGLEKETR